MARFQITFQKIQNGKIVSTAGTSVEANSIMEAKNKFMSNHLPTNTYSYRIVSCVKKQRVKMSQKFDENSDLGKELEEFEKQSNAFWTEMNELYNEIQNNMELLEIAEKEQENYESLEKQLTEHPENEVEIKAEMLAIEKKVDGLMAQIKPLETEEKQKNGILWRTFR